MHNIDDDVKGGRMAIDSSSQIEPADGRRSAQQVESERPQTTSPSHAKRSNVKHVRDREAPEAKVELVHSNQEVARTRREQPYSVQSIGGESVRHG